MSSENLFEIDNSSPITQHMEIISDDAFSYAGYQVVRAEFFSHPYEPSITFNRSKVSVNRACIRKLPNVEYIQILVNPESKKLVVRPCAEEERNSFRWCTDKRAPKQISANIFFLMIFSLMQWNPDYRYKLLGKLVRAAGQMLFVFDLNSPEVYARIVTEDGKVKPSRKPLYPESWKNQFGIPYSEHVNSLQINKFDRYVVFGVENGYSRKKEEASNVGEQNDTADALAQSGLKV